MSKLPEGWTTANLKELFEFKYGKGLIQEERNATGSINVYGSNGVVGKHDEALTNGKTIIIGRKGSVGEVNLSAEKCWAIDTTYYVDEFACDLPSEYWALYLKSLRLGQQDKSSAIPGISRDDIYSIAVLLPPLNEQRRIMAKLEKLLRRVDAAQARLATISRILKRFRQSVLAAACSGRLTADRREGSSGNSSAESIVESLFEQRISEAETVAKEDKIRAIYEHKEENDSEELPEGWRFVTLSKLCESFDYGSSAKSQPSGLIPVLRMGNIQNGEIDWSDLVYTSDEDEIVKYSLEPQTVLFNRTNSPELVGKTAIYRGEQAAIFAGYLIRVNNYDVLDSAYLNYCLNTNYARDYCLSVKTDGVSQSNINAQKLAKFEVPFGPLHEQQEIVRRVEALFKTADALEARYRTAKAHVDRLAQSILARAFRGELVNTEAELARQEGRDYEPASVLLERIQQERTQQQEAAKPKPKRTARGKKDNGTKRMFA